ncbi:MAG: hypothetical protein IJ024_02830 [Lachnospiraceae bacterium]|nr:hypothetical protein [Lachnospiraceae bacterium]
MVTVLLITLSYLWNDFLYVYFFRRVLNEKYSSEVTFWGTILLWVIQFFTKIIPTFVSGLEMTVFLSFFMMVLHLIHLFILFEGSVLKRIVVFFLALTVQGFMDLLGLNLTSIIVGNYELWKTGSVFNFVAVFVSSLCITVGITVLTKLWQLLEKIEWKMTKTEWLCAILPLSQVFLMWHFSVVYSINHRAIPTMIMVGCILSFLADAYMLLLFVRLSKKNEAKKELERLKYQYELEQVRYEQLKAGQEETAKIRHDFQNYIMTLKRME